MKRSLSMLNRLKANLADFFQQADLVLLGLCCVATLWEIYSKNSSPFCRTS